MKHLSLPLHLPLPVPSPWRLPRSWRPAAAALALLLTGGCSTLLPAAPAPPLVYSLDNAQDAPVGVPRGAVSAPASAPASAPRPGPTLIVNTPRAAPGFDSPHIVYVRQAHQLEHFAHSEWVDTPARMLAPLIVAAFQNGGGFTAVALAPSTAAGEFRLDTELVRLQQEFGPTPSRVRFTLRATLVDNATRRVLASREFETALDAPSDDPYGGVLAANQAVRAVLSQLVAFGNAVALSR